MHPRPILCQQIGVKGYPTWTINGRRYEGVLTLAQLAEASRFSGLPAASTPGQGPSRP